MKWDSHEEARLKRYLLGTASTAEQEQVEERLLRSDEAAERLVLLEEELIDDYARGALPAGERTPFEQYFLVTAKRRAKLEAARDLVRYASQSGVAVEAQAALAAALNEREQAERGAAPANWARQWWQEVLAAWWKVAVAAVLVLGLGVGFWRWQARPSELEQGLLALDQAYRAGRPIEARITGFHYAPFRSSIQRGGQAGANESAQVDYVALERARTVLFGSTAIVTTPATLQALGRYYLAQKEFDRAIEQYRKALALAPAEAQLHSELGAALLGRIERDRQTAANRSPHDLEACSTHLNRALELNPTLPEAWFNRALLRQRERLHREARADWEKYLQLDSTSLWAEEARQYLNAIQREVGKVLQRREQLYQEFISAAASRANKQALAAINLSYSFNGNSIIEKLVGDFLTAKLNERWHEAEEPLRMLEYFGKAVAEQTQDRFASDLARYYRQASAAQLALSAQARAVSAQAYSFYQKSENDRAVALYEQAQRDFARAGNEGEALFAEAWIGHCHHQRAAVEQNLRVFTRLAPLLKQKSYVWMLANATCGLANAQNSSGQFSRAIAAAQQCGKLSEQVGDTAGKLRSLYPLGNFYYTLGKHAENLRLSQQGLKLSAETAAENRYAINFYNLTAWSLSALELPEAALSFQREVIQLAAESQSPRLSARAQIYLGLIYSKWRKYDEAIASVQRGIAIGQQLATDETGQEFVHRGLLQLGHIYRAAGRLNEALAAFNQVMAYFQKSKSQQYFYGASKGRLLTYIAQGADAAARAELAQVLALYEKYRRAIQEESNRNSFFDQEQNIYDVAIDYAYTALRDPRQAFDYSELCRARSLLAARERGWELIADPQALDLRLNEGASPLSVNELQRQLPAGVQLLEYAVLEDKLIGWLISRKLFEAHRLKLTLAQLQTLVKRHLQFVAQAPDKLDQRWRESAMELHEALLRPFEAVLDRQQQLCIVPDKLLSQLSFAALISRDSNRFLVQDYALSYAASANLFVSLSREASRKASSAPERLLAVGNPRFESRFFPALADLPAAEREAKAVAAYYDGPTLLVGAQATKRAVLRHLAQADIVHLATHYVPDAWSPLVSCLPLASEGREPEVGCLQAHELYRSKSPLSPRLLVLSACQTQAEDYYDGEGAIRIARSFELVGIPLVVASLWPVDTDATAALMQNFHRARKQERQTSVAALRAAQMRLIEPGDYLSHPYYWAAFTVVGGHSEY